MDEIHEQRICLKFCFKIGKTATESYKLLQQAFGDNAIKQTTAFEWFKKFKDGRQSVLDDVRIGRPVVVRQPAKIEKIRDMIYQNRRITIREIVEEMGVSFGTVQKIIHEDLRLKRKASKFVPKILTPEQKEIRKTISQNMLEMVSDDKEWMNKVISGDETWVYGYDPETKRQSSQWLARDEPKPKKARLSKSSLKVLLVTFFDNQGLVHHEYLPEGLTINQVTYLAILRRLRESVRKKRPEKWHNKDWFIHFDNARPHMAGSVLSFLAKNNTLLLPQPPYSPDLSPNDFFLYPKLKSTLKGKRFDTRDEIITKSQKILRSLEKNDFSACFENWKKRWKRCVDAEGSYFEEY